MAHLVRDVLSQTASAEQEALSCEVLTISGLRVPLGAIAALPIDLEAWVSLLLEGYLRDGELSADEIEDLEEVFGLIDDGLLDELEDLLDELLP